MEIRWWHWFLLFLGCVMLIGGIVYALVSGQLAG